jgi:tRNA/tmRNA/rRNA uracil-C5-methylase (TrmA/RlmC/RlmD family)
VVGEPPWVGARLAVDVGPPAHGGHCVARHEGRVVFVRHALPGERVVAQVTEDHGGSFCRADAVQVLRASADRVDPPCPHAGPGRCGGCDWQHAAAGAQRRLKAEVVRDVLHRIGGLAESSPLLSGLVVQAADDRLLGWRTRAQLSVDRRGQSGFRRSRSAGIEPISVCPLLTPGLQQATARGRWPARATVGLCESGSGEVAVDVRRSRAGGAAGPSVTEHAVGRDFVVQATGFWQVHPRAADLLADAVVALVDPRPEERAVDLYAGVGLFAAALAARTTAVVAVEADATACGHARHNLADLPQATVRHERVSPALIAELDFDVAVVDPPRSGLGADVTRAILGRAPRALAYVACDPAALARDVKVAAGAGYRLAALRAFDLFPMTAHVECVALLTRTGEP